jgi:transglutaminase-like putative cysteine protease
VLIEVTHTTELTYDEPIRGSQMELRVCPAQLADQARLSFELAIGPRAQVHGYFDWLDNHVHAFGIDGWHETIRISAVSTMRTYRADADIATLEVVPDTWPLEGVREDYRLYDYLTLEGPLKPTEELDRLVKDVDAKEGELLGTLAGRALTLLRDRFEYKTGATNSATPLGTFLKKERGVCQDFTHAYVAVMRKLGVPTRYVSGIVHEDLGYQFLGASQTHAWAEVLFPSMRSSDGAGGWVGLDPTNGVRAGPTFVKVANGRHFNDVPPNRGVYMGSANETISVDVQTRTLPSVPPELQAERFRSINVQATPAPLALAASVDGQQQQQQQQ